MYNFHTLWSTTNEFVRRRTTPPMFTFRATRRNTRDGRAIPVSCSNCVVTIKSTYEIRSIQNRISRFNGGQSHYSRAETLPCTSRTRPACLSLSCTSASYTTRNSIPSTRFETDQTTRRREKWKNRITTISNIGRVSRKRPPEKCRSTSTRPGMDALHTKCPTVIDHA